MGHSEKFAFHDNQLIYVPRVGHKLTKIKFFSETVNKVALSADDDKRIILWDGVSTNAWGREGS